MALNNVKLGTFHKD